MYTQAPPLGSAQTELTKVRKVSTSEAGRDDD